MLCTIELDIKRLYPAFINHDTEREYVRRLKQFVLRFEKTTDEDLPMAASEDFFYFLH